MIMKKLTSSQQRLVELMQQGHRLHSDTGVGKYGHFYLFSPESQPSVDVNNVTARSLIKAGVIETRQDETVYKWDQEWVLNEKLRK